MANNKYAAFFAAYNSSVKRGNPLSREEQISQFTDGRTESLKELTVWELNELTMRLNADSPDRFQKPVRTAAQDKADRMRKAIIAIFYKMDSTAADAKAWTEKQGVGGVKKRFNDYTTQELYKLMIRAEKALADYQLGIRNGLKRMTE